MKKDARSDSGVLAEDVRQAVGRFVRAVRSDSGTATTAQSEVLAQLARTGPATVAALAQLRGVTHQSMRLVAARLVGQGLLEMLPNPDDGRSQLAALTRTGHAQVRTDQAARAGHLAQLLDARLSAAERDVLARAVVLLNRLSDGE